MHSVLHSVHIIMIEEGEESTEEVIDDVKGPDVNDLEQQEADTGGAATVFALGFSSQVPSQE